MEKQKLEVGKIYDVVSQRKGKFKMQLIHHDETWEKKRLKTLP